MIEIELTRGERIRATNAANRIAASFAHYWRERQPIPGYLVQRRDNLREFLRRFPGLRQYRGVPSLSRLKGKRLARWEPCGHLPGADHTFWWSTKGVQGPIVATTFPYHWTDDTHAQASAFALEHGLQLEVRPPDVPDLWVPGSTIPIVWARGGVDWRKAATSDTEAR